MHLSHFLSNKDNELIFRGAALFMPDRWLDGRCAAGILLFGLLELLWLGRRGDDVMIGGAA